MSESTDQIFETIIGEVVNSEAIASLSSAHNQGVFSAAVTMATEKLKAALSNEAFESVSGDIDSALQDAFSDNDFYQCEVTGATLHVDDTTSIIYGSRRETAIISGHFNTFECNDCGENFLSYSGRSFNSGNIRTYATSSYDTENGTVCTGCYEENYQSCGDCGESYSHDNMRYHESNGESYCENCFPTGLDCVTNRLTLPRAAESSADSLAVGWEIEFYPSDSASPPSSEHVERIYQDGSLTSEGREITTQPALPSQWKARLSALEDCLDGGYIGPDCGGHLHVDGRYLHSLLWQGYLNINALRNEFNALDGALRQLRNIPGVRTGTAHVAAYNSLSDCFSQVSTQIATYDQSRQVKKINQIQAATVYYQNVLRLLCDRKRNESTYARPQTISEPSYDKYTALNISGLSQGSERQTVEFRLWGGCIDTDDLYFRAQVCEAIVRKMTEVAEWMNQDNEVSKQKVRQFIDSKSASDLQTQVGFWDIFGDGQASFECVKACALELGLSEEWLTWARGKIIDRKPEKALAA